MPEGAEAVPRRRIGSALLFLALTAGILAYFGVEAWRYFADPLSTALAYPWSQEESLELTGWVVRDELPLDDAGGLLRPLRAEGERVSAGGALALVYDGPEDLERQDAIDALETRLAQLRWARDAGRGARLDDQIRSGILERRADLVAGRLDQAEDRGADLRSLVVRRDLAGDDPDALDARIAQTETALASLEEAASPAVREIAAPRAGLWSASADGYEGVLGPDLLDGLRPSDLSGIEPEEAGEGGKLVLGDTWWYAAALPVSDAAALEERKELSLRFSTGVDRDLPVTLTSVSAEEGGRVAVVFTGRARLQDVTLLRRQSALAVFGTVEGLRVPKEALRMVERAPGSDGADPERITGLYCLVGAQARFKPVEVLHTDRDFLVVRAAAEEGQERLLLRPGDEVIVRARDLYDGKVVAAVN